MNIDNKIVIYNKIKYIFYLICLLINQYNAQKVEILMPNVTTTQV